MSFIASITAKTGVDINKNNEISFNNKKYPIKSVVITGIHNKLLGKTNSNISFISQGKIVTAYFYFEFKTLEGLEGSYSIDNNNPDHIINSKISGYTWIDSGQIRSETDLAEAQCEIKRNPDGNYYIKLAYKPKSGVPIEVIYSGNVDIFYTEI